jgi:hypothetical protein
MGMIVLIVLFGAAAYYLLRRATERGANTVRAYLYLRAINEGASVSEANQIAHVDLASGSHHLSIPQAQEYVRLTYGGKQLPIIADAISRGLVL